MSKNIASTAQRSLAQRLSLGELTIGSWITLAHPAIAEIMARTGFDWLTIDLEHSVITIREAEELIRIITLHQVPALVRLTCNDANQIKRVMDAGASGVIVPMVESAAQLTSVRNACRWPPGGSRGVGFSRANLFGQHFDAYREEAQAPLLVAMIENFRAVNDLDAILAVDGLDAILIGPYDLSASLGITGCFEDERFVVAMACIAEKARSAGIPAGVHVVKPSPQELADRIDEGYRFLAYSIDAVMLRQTAINPRREGN